MTSLSYEYVQMSHESFHLNLFHFSEEKQGFKMIYSLNTSRFLKPSGHHQFSNHALEAVFSSDSLVYLDKMKCKCIMHIIDIWHVKAANYSPVLEPLTSPSTKHPHFTLIERRQSATRWVTCFSKLEATLLLRVQQVPS